MKEPRLRLTLAYLLSADLMTKVMLPIVTFASGDRAPSLPKIKLSHTGRLTETLEVLCN
jgi:hypothetical protein